MKLRNDVRSPSCGGSSSAGVSKAAASTAVTNHRAYSAGCRADATHADDFLARALSGVGGVAEPGREREQRQHRDAQRVDIDWWGDPDPGDQPDRHDARRRPPLRGRQQGEHVTHQRKERLHGCTRTLGWSESSMGLSCNTCEPAASASCRNLALPDRHQVADGAIMQPLTLPGAGGCGPPSLTSLPVRNRGRSGAREPAAGRGTCLVARFRRSFRGGTRSGVEAGAGGWAGMWHEPSGDPPGQAIAMAMPRMLLVPDRGRPGRRGLATDSSAPIWRHA